MSNIPKLRFPEFSGEWEEKKFSEIVYLENERDVCKKSDYITTENLNKDYAGVTFNTNSNEIVPGIKYLKDDILFGNIRPYLKKVWQADRNGCVNSDVLVFKIIKDNSKFINNIICSDLFLSHVMNGAKGTKMPRGDKNQMMDFIAKIPSLPEQQKIADFLSNVDSIITAETKILNTLQKRKKALMQKLFTQQLRFKSDDGTDFPAWEERKLEDVCDIIGGGTPDTNKAEYWNGNIQWFTPTEIGNTKYISESKRKITQLGFEKSSAKLLPVGTILFTSRATLGEMSITTVECTTNQGFQSLIPNKNFIDPDYLYYLQPILQKYCYSKASGSTFLEISAKSLKECHIPLPCKEEQQKIADCLSSLDSLIQTQQKVVTTWQQRKKALLQQMFI